MNWGEIISLVDLLAPPQTGKGCVLVEAMPTTRIELRLGSVFGGGAHYDNDEKNARDESSLSNLGII